MLEFYKALILIVDALIYFPGSIQDFREREVSDVYLYLPYFSYLALFFLYGIKILFLSLLMVTVTLPLIYYMYKKNLLAEGDLIGFPSVFSQFFAFYLLATYLALVTSIDLLAVYLRKGGLKVSKDKLNSEDLSKWLKSGDEVYQYGVPLIGYVYLSCFLSDLTYLALVLIFHLNFLPFL